MDQGGVSGKGWWSEEIAQRDKDLDKREGRECERKTK